MCHFSAARKVLRHISRHCGWYLINIWWTWRLLRFWFMSLDQLKSNELREITTFKSRTWLWNCSITTVKNDWQTFYTECPKVEVVWGRLVGFVSGSLPAMGCGGSKAQPTSEVVQPMCSLCLLFLLFIRVRVQAIVFNVVKKYFLDLFAFYLCFVIKNSFSLAIGF